MRMPGWHPFDVCSDGNIDAPRSFQEG